MQKGFNMFTALVAAILIMTSVVLVSTMTTTETKMGNQLYFMLNTFQLNDAAAIARSDALQSFNYNFRASMQDYLSFDDGEMENEPGFNILTTSNHNDWGGIVDNFEKVILLTNASGTHNFDAVIKFVADRTILQFNEGSYGRYHVSLSSKDQSARDNTKNVLNKAIECLAINNDDFLEVVGCNENECELGTFYFNIPLDCVADEDYETLPKIVVKDLITKGETKLPILPRTRLKIYIPLRFFKAIFVARKNAEAMENAERGAKFREAKLGFCDSGSCTPRTSPTSSEGGDWDKECPGSASDNELQKLDSEPAGLTHYNTGGGTVANIGLNAYAKQAICEYAGLSGLDAAYINDNEFFNINDSRYSGTGGAYPNQSLPGLEADISGISFLEDCPFKTILASVESEANKVIKGSGSGKLYCGKIRDIQADVAYEERNKLYIVKGEKLRYKIRITTDYYPEPVGGTDECTSGVSPKQCSV